MRATFTAALLALASSVLAQTPGFDVVSKPSNGEVIPAGTAYLITWAPSTNASWTGTVTIDLLGGADQKTQGVLSTLAAGVASSAGQYSWAVDSGLGGLAVYGIRIKLDSDPTVFQYSFPFKIQATSSSSSSSSSSAPTSSSSTWPSSSAPPAPGISTSTSNGGASSISTTAKPIATPTGASSGGNLSTTRHPSATGNGTSSPSSTGSAVAGSPGSVVRASSLALFGGLALAFFTL